MTEEERANRNPAPEVNTVKFSDLHELKIADLQARHVYILHGRKGYFTWNFMGTRAVLPNVLAYIFYGPRVNLTVVLRERPDQSGTLEDAAGLKVTIYRYDGEDV